MRIIDLLESVQYDFDLEDLHILETDASGDYNLLYLYDISNGNYSNVPDDARLYKVIAWKVMAYTYPDGGVQYYDLLVWV